MKRLPFLLDCDPGIDDAFAIFCALKFGDLERITTVSGNVSIEHTTKNALHLLDLAGAHVPVHRGSDRPLRVDPCYADDIHGASGLGNYQTPNPTQVEQDTDAISAIIDYCAGGDTHIVATGPLTNIARALEHDPTVAERIAGLHWMGGGTTRGNTTAFAEFNAWCDPDAVAVTMSSGVPLTMYDLDLTHQVRMGERELAQLRSADTELATFCADALEFYSLGRAPELGAKAMHDPCAVLGFLRPALFTTRRSNIVAVTTADAQRGRTIVTHDGGPLPHAVATTADSQNVIDLILQAIIEPENTP